MGRHVHALEPMGSAEGTPVGEGLIMGLLSIAGTAPLQPSGFRRCPIALPAMGFRMGSWQTATTLMLDTPSIAMGRASNTLH